MPETGLKTWQESRDSLVEGFRWLTKAGVIPTFHAIRLGVGSVYGDDKASRAKLALEAAVLAKNAYSTIDVVSVYPTLAVGSKVGEVKRRVKSQIDAWVFESVTHSK